jgi:hypothetical protein
MDMLSRAMFDRGLPESGTFAGQPPWQLFAASATASLSDDLANLTTDFEACR